MQIKPLGKITVNAKQQVSTTEKFANSLLIKAGSANVGIVWIGDSTLTKATGVGVYAYLLSGELFDAASHGLNDISPTDVYLDADTGTDVVFAGIGIR